MTNEHTKLADIQYGLTRDYYNKLEYENSIIVYWIHLYIYVQLYICTFIKKKKCVIINMLWIVASKASENLISEKEPRQLFFL